jgi:hypothetical protein
MMAASLSKNQDDCGRKAGKGVKAAAEQVQAAVPEIPRRILDHCHFGSPGFLRINQSDSADHSKDSGIISVRLEVGHIANRSTRPSPKSLHQNRASDPSPDRRTVFVYRGTGSSAPSASDLHSMKTQEGGFPMPTQKTPTLVRNEPSQNLEEQIRSRAYELYEARGRDNGHDMEDWLRAESEISGNSSKAAA